MWYVYYHDVATCLPGQLVYSLGLACARSAVEEAGKATTETMLAHAFLDLHVLVLLHEGVKLVDLMGIVGGIVHRFGG